MRSAICSIVANSIFKSRLGDSMKAVRLSRAIRPLHYLLMACALSVFASVEAAEPQLAFPGAMGWAADTKGGRGGKIIRVTTLAPSGPGSLLEALDTDGPRIVVFEVGGV